MANSTYQMHRQTGMTLIELMTALAIGMVILGAISMLFANMSQSRDELERHSRQIENGRFAVDRLREEVRVAGFFGEVLPVNTHWQSVPAAENNCDPLLGWDNSVTAAEAAVAGEVAPWTVDHVHVPPGLSGVNDTAGGAPVSCLEDVKAGSDILVVRRVATTEVAVGAGTPGVLYLQNSMCNSDALPFVIAAAGAAGTQAATYPLRPRYCGTVPVGSPARVPLRQLKHTVFFLASCNDCTGSGDGVPTLKRLEYRTGATLNVADIQTLVDGIEEFEVEYGVDADGNGVPDGPYVTAAAVADWSQVVAARLFILSRSATERPEYPVDTKTYVVASDGTSVGPYNDRRRRQLMSTVVQVGNAANWRESY